MWRNYKKRSRRSNKESSQGASTLMEVPRAAKAAGRPIGARGAAKLKMTVGLLDNLNN